MSSAAPADSTAAVLTRFVARYKSETPLQVRITDSFLVCTLLVAAVQFAYCVLVRSTFPFNSLLSGLISAIGVFVLTGACGGATGVLRIARGAAGGERAASGRV